MQTVGHAGYGHLFAFKHLSNDHYVFAQTKAIVLHH
jgi:hypothetical protein